MIPDGRNRLRESLKIHLSKRHEQIVEVSEYMVKFETQREDGRVGAQEGERICDDGCAARFYLECGFLDRASRILMNDCAPV